ncbi:MAG: hypothetical protein K9M98_05515 [Cephaloticoccus sp.]|nr:hypothetical protein [Cephaloticoccus sp.]MCF7759942.1 hypothetical protein [Cephaloticoccus sp.]
MRSLLLMLLLTGAGASAQSQSFLQTVPADPPRFPAPPTNRLMRPLPGGSPNEIYLGRFTTQWDGMPVRLYRMRVGSLDLQLTVDDLSDWPILENGNYSLNMISRWDRTVSAYLAWFPKGMFLNDLDDAAWQSYLSTIPRRTFLQTNLLINDDSETNPSMIRILNSRTRVLYYEEFNSRTQSKERAYVQVFTEQADGILLIGLEGQAKNVANAKALFARLLLRICPYDPNSNTIVQ